MQIEIEPNPNCEGTDQFVFQELGPARPILAVHRLERGQETICPVIGVDTGGVFIAASAVKITDSGEGFAFAIIGGKWGIRMKPEAASAEPWDLGNPRQWGEPFKIYGSEEDLVYA